MKLPIIGTDKTYYMDGWLVSNLDFCVKRIVKRWDNCVLIDGDEGVGKSTLGKACGYYVGTKLETGFTAENIFMDISKMEEFAKNERKKVIVWDEAALGGLAEDWQDDYQKRLVKLMITCRKYGHMFIFILPQFSTLRRYLAVNRSIALIRCYTPDRISRGYFRVYGKEKKEELYRLEKEHKNSHGVIPSFFGRYVDVSGMLIDEEEYERKKDEAIQLIGKEKEDKRDMKWKLRCMKLVSLLKDKERYSLTKIAKEIGIDQGQFHKDFTNFQTENGIITG